MKIVRIFDPEVGQDWPFSELKNAPVSGGVKLGKESF